MICPLCGAASHVLSSRPGANFTTVRRRQCEAVKAHRFNSTEMHDAPARTAHTRLTAASMQTRILTLQRNVEIAQTLHHGAKVIGERYGLKIPSVYAAAARGRAHLAAMRKP